MRVKHIQYGVALWERRMSSLVREEEGRERRLLSSDLHHSVQPQESADHSLSPAVLSAQLLKKKKGE